MNLSRLFEMQKALDEKIVKEKGLEGHDLLPQKILALQVELGELANEWRGFKFWSKDQQPKITGTRKCKPCKGLGFITVTSIPIHQQTVTGCPACKSRGGELYNPLLEEYADCLHFILNIGHETGRQRILDFNFPTFGSITTIEIIQKFNTLFMCAAMMMEDDYNYQSLLDHFGDLGYMLGFTWDQIEQAYMSKNEVNHSRQANGY